MKTQDFKKETCSWLGSFLEYPINDEAITATDNMTPMAMGGQAKAFLEDFFTPMRAMSLGARQEYYVRTFDVLPVCSLYLSVHLFGEESFKRSELMTGLKAIYDKHPSVGIAELPDHLGVVLKHNDFFSDEEWNELVGMCILPALVKMIDRLEKARNPYAFVLKAIQALLMEKENVHA